ncbi:polysaccharide pyruvyl transferase family protein [Psychrobacter proteolyticus]|uniref:Tetratricopeptide repeat protein n=1 Tax=Psychrobacter proteolyticus TaxID=147825 RepID=A0ABV0D3S9_9GAMM
MKNVDEKIDELNKLLQKNEYDKVIENANFIIQGDGLSNDIVNYNILFNTGHAYKNLAQYDESKIQFDLLIQRFPEKYQGFEGLVNIAQHQQDWNKVIEHAVVFQKKFPDMWHSYWWLGQAYKNLGKYKEAVVQFNILLDRFPKKHQGLEGLVNVSQHRKHWNKVIERALVFQSKFPTLWHSYWWLGQAYKNTAQYDKANVQFDLLMLKFPKRHQGLKGQITVYQSLNDWEKVVELAQKLIALYPDLWIGYWYLGEAYFNMKRYDAALEPLEILQEKSPSHILGINFYVNTLSKIGRLDEAKRYSENKIKDLPTKRSLKDNYVKLFSNTVYQKNSFAQNSKPFFIEGSYKINDNDITEKPILKTFWWDAKPNFGDWIGPLLINNIFDIECVNMRNKSADHVLYTVGSVVQMTEYQPHRNIKIWGSGLIRPLDTGKSSKIFEKLNDTSVISLRGKLTYQELAKHINIKEEEISFGDPALLLPRVYEPKVDKSANKDICIVPHYVHKYYFLSEKSLMENFNVVDVQTTPANVINQIASSKVCISSSLHGVIIAQAYGIPWIWLKIEDDLLTRDQHQDFKFFDFFSVMDFPDRFSKLSIYTKDINIKNINIAAKTAKLMEMSSNFNDMIEDLNGFIHEKAML